MENLKDMVEKNFPSKLEAKPDIKIYSHPIYVLIKRGEVLDSNISRYSNEVLNHIKKNISDLDFNNEHTQIKIKSPSLDFLIENGEFKELSVLLPPAGETLYGEIPLIFKAAKKINAKVSKFVFDGSAYTSQVFYLLADNKKIKFACNIDFYSNYGQMYFNRLSKFLKIEEDELRQLLDLQLIPSEGINKCFPKYEVKTSLSWKDPNLEINFISRRWESNNTSLREFDLEIPVNDLEKQLVELTKLFFDDGKHFTNFTPVEPRVRHPLIYEIEKNGDKAMLTHSWIYFSPYSSIAPPLKLKVDNLDSFQTFYKDIGKLTKFLEKNLKKRD